MRRCAFMTLEDAQGYVIDDDLAREPMHHLGWTVDAVPWRSAPDWTSWEVVVLRSTWDYHRAPAEFLGVLEGIRAAGILLLNPLELVRWNLTKDYLQELEEERVPVVPTLWRNGLTPGGLAVLWEEVGAEALVIKPQVGASAAGLVVVDRGTEPHRIRALEEAYAHRPLMAQPLLASVSGEGEYSVVVFDEEVSHAVRKRPAPGDQRAQEEHGATLEAVPVSDELARAAQQILEALTRRRGTRPLYARMDLARGEDGRLLLMELELIEPSLYLRMDPAAPERFARALDRRWRSTRGG